MWARAVVLALIPCVPLVQMRVDAALGAFRSQEEVLYLWTGRHVKRLAPGFEDLMADVYWLRTVQYFGGQRVYRHGKQFDLLLPLIEITTTLDPRLEIAYRFGSIFLSEPPPVGAGNPKAGVALLERGCQVFPQSWRLRQDLGFFTFFFLEDSKRASEILLEASEIPGAAYWLKNMAADILSRSGEREMSRRIWKQMFEQSEKGAIKVVAGINVQRLDALDAVDVLHRMIEEYVKRAGARPRSLAQLKDIRSQPIPMADPTGVPFSYDPESGRVSISRESQLWSAGR